MAKRIKEVDLLDDMTIKQALEPDKVVVVVLDGKRGIVRKCEAVEHGETIVETINGKFKKVHFHESELA
ncbi:terminase [Bacillus ginsengihumi]|uniref:Terminase n=1 Tax=Heyndrickxia ginsengihumi TaxID=363870 RepID=A0A0A6VBQ6_9BACI|nr:XtrA/YqaO family protein [Heyndrickxia ginsengihumi]KHD85670.1 terminase [Heyndrickxia ginsengihumi]NEY20519.1 terminase [Heyndrickxia ginsengihumi]